MMAEVLSGMTVGIKGELVSIQADVSDGLPVFHMIGSLSGEVKEAKERVRTALKNTGYRLPPGRIAVNLAPADLRKTGTAFDLAIAAALFAAMNLAAPGKTEGVLFLGELSLDGDIKGVHGVLPIVKAASEQGCRRFILPEANVREAAMIPETRVIGFGRLKDMLDYLKGELNREESGGEDARVYAVAEGKLLPCPEKEREEEGEAPCADLSQVKGQKLAKKALEIAVAGYHNLLLDGPPGVGKSMLASCIPGIMPDMTWEESLETTMIYSVRGMLDEAGRLISRRPCRSPGRMATMVGLFGGGNTPKPGEVSLAHHGVLFLDELPEFRREVIEAFRVVLEEHRIVQIRQGRTVVFPADFIFVAAANPCPCGYYPNRNRCTCTESMIARYQNKISGPILDRFDLSVRCGNVTFDDLVGGPPEESSAAVKERIARAWERQRARGDSGRILFNGRLSQKNTEEICRLGEAERKLMALAYERFHLTGRGYYRVLKTARTIADLAGEEEIRTPHLEEALLFRRSRTTALR